MNFFLIDLPELWKYFIRTALTIRTVILRSMNIKDDHWPPRDKNIDISHCEIRQ